MVNKRTDRRADGNQRIVWCDLLQKKTTAKKCMEATNQREMEWHNLMKNR